MNLNQDEKHRLAKQFTADVIEQKAKEMGVDPSDLMLRTWDGKNKLSKKSDVYAQLDKQRQLVAPKKVIRSIRGGQNSMISQINNEIKTCRMLVDELIRLKYLERKEQGDFKAALIKLENRTLSLEKSLRDVENKIDEIKRNDVVFDDAESVLAEMQQAKEQSDRDRLMDLQTNYQELLKQYYDRRKTLEPSIQSARRLRLDLQREFWTVQQIHFKLGNLNVARIKKSLTLISQAMEGDEQHQTILTEFKTLHTHHGRLMSHQANLVAHYPPSHIDMNEATRTLDALLPEMIKTLDYVNELTYGFNALLDQYGLIDPDLLKQTSQRMAYAEKKLD